MEDGILDNLLNIKGYVLDDGVVEKSTLGGHFTHVHRRNETRRDEVMPNLGNIGQMLGLEVQYVPFIVKLPLTSPVGQDPDELRVVWSLIEPIKRLIDSALKSTNTPRTQTFLTTWEARLA